MNVQVWRWGALALVASLCPGLPAGASQADDKKDKPRQLLPATGEEDSDVPTPPQRPSPSKPGGPDPSSQPGPKRQAAFPAVPGARLTLAPGAHYRASGLHRVLMGQHYRHAWATPVPVEVLDLRTYGGGLKPVKKGGGKQTMSLTFEAPDGRRYKFRSTDKDPGPALEPKLRDTLAETILHDQISASHPGAPLMVDALSAAAGIPHVTHRMFVLPDDDALGEFRQEFAGQFGMLEQVVDEDHPVPPGFEGLTKIVETDTLFERLDKDPAERVDARSYLRGRLFDIFLGDWDRHARQWEWIRREKDGPWRAFPVDRDLAFIHFDGMIPRIMSRTHPMLVTFGPLYPRVLGLAWNSRVLDRRLLGGLELDAYREVARELQQGLTDQAIGDAVHRLPSEWFALDGEHFITSLKGRRDRLPQVAEEFYHLLSGEVELHGTNAAETVEIRRDEGGATVVVMRNEGSSDPLVERRFRDDTREVRLYLKGGDDRVQTFGTTGDGVDVRVAAGPGDDVLDDTQGGGTGLYDHEGRNTVLKGEGTRVNTHYWVQPTDMGGFPLRDWGGGNSIGPWITAGADLGVLLGARLRHKDYGFRRLPYSSLQTLRAGYSTGRTGWKAEYIGDFMHTASYREHRLRAMVSDIELVRFYGFGNETPAGRSSEFFRADQRLYLLSPSYRWGSRAVGVWLGALGKFSDVRPSPDTFIGQTRPYGVDDFGQVGPQLSFVVDTRDTPSAARRGVYLNATGIYYPQVWDVDQQFADTHGELSAYLTPVGPVTLALRAGGKKVWGDLFPFHEAAFIGGPDNVRGLRRNRFAGDASAFGTAELRLRLGEFTAFAPVEVGVFGFGDIGRVWVDDDTSDIWHTGLGGGLSLSFIQPENTISLSMAWPGTFRDGRFRSTMDGDNKPRFYLHGGFTF